MVCRFALPWMDAMGRLLLILLGALTLWATDTPPAWSQAPAPAGLQRIVLDPGHGGEDLGTQGHGALEKELTLALALALQERLEEAFPGVEVRLTRTGDDYPTLDERAHLANAWQADVFISLHLNAAPNPLAEGIETFHLAPAGTAPGQIVPGQEEFGPARLFDPVGPTGALGAALLEDLRRVGAHRGSVHLAHTLQQALLLATGAHDRGVRTGQFRVLRGLRMPGVVVELGFLSHAREGARLLDAEYQTQLLEGLVAGLQALDARHVQVSMQWPVEATRPVARVGGAEDACPPPLDSASGASASGRSAVW